MFISWHPGLALSDYPFIVVGAGPAGLYLANALSSRGKVLIIEAGNTEDTTNPGEGIYDLVSTGRDYPSVGTRLTAFGGTSNHWGGHTRPLSKAVFSDRTGIARWPISYEDYATHVADACKFLHLAPFEDGPERPSIVSGIFEDHEHLKATQFRYSSPIVRFGNPGFVEQYRASAAIDILTDTRLMDIDLSADGARVEAISLLHRSSKERARIAVGQLFLCAGAIENARILLWAGRKYPSGNPLLGGPNQLTGSNFLEKTYFPPIEMFVDTRVDLTHSVAEGGYMADLCWELSADFLKEHNLPRFGVFPRGSTDEPFDSPDIEQSSSIYAQTAPAYLKLEPAFQFEQTPHAGSYVSLSGEFDADGVARPELHWEIAAADIEAYRKATLIFCGVLSQKGYARCRLKPAYKAADWSGVYLGLCNHHMGTTRMGASKLDGVVDPDCRVFGLENFFVGGSSVFPSSDYVNPTLSLVALAGRLADHVIRKGEAS